MTKINPSCSTYQAQPERWAEDYSDSLSNLANVYSAVNRTKEATELNEEASQIQRVINKAQPRR